MKRIGLFFGGMSNEAEISILSARNIASHLDTSRFSLVPIFWDTDGNFRLVENLDDRSEKLIDPSGFKNVLDVAFPITHGKFGEDGILQAIFESQLIPYCGCRVLASALCMDKARFKTLLSGHNIRQAKFIVVKRSENPKNETEYWKQRLQNLAFPVFVKPSNSGSSVGITRVSEHEALGESVLEARQYDDTVIIEEGLTDFQEIEISVIGDEELVASVPGRIIPSNEFYDYDDKYVLNQTKFEIPANLESSISDQAKSLALKAYNLCGCTGFARVDLFIKQGDVYMNEINTLPGFTNISMYPKLMEASGIPYQELLSRIIELAR